MKLPVKILLFSVLCINIACLNAMVSDSCPCKLPSNDFEDSHNKVARKNICIENLKGSYVQLPYVSGNIDQPNIIVLKGKEYSKCSAVISFVDGRDTFARRTNSCPGKCSPVPFIRLPETWLTNKPTNGTQITCSSRIEDYTNVINDNKFNPITIILSIYYRRLQECYEQNIWHNIIPQKYIFRHKIHSLVIWTGTDATKK